MDSVESDFAVCDISPTQKSSIEKRAVLLRLLADRGWVSLKQLSLLLGVAYPTVIRMRDTHKVATMRIGGIYRVSIEEYNRLQREGNRGQTHGAEAARATGEASRS